jgi:two-component system cell cycle sensor histidine kinase PleC
MQHTEGEPLRRPAPRSADDGAQQLRLLAHELRTPLAAIAALAEMMRDERFGPLGDARYRGYARDIHDSAMHALDVLAALVECREAGAPAGVDLGALALASASAMRPLAERAGVTLETSISIDLPPLRASPRSLRQILLNLLSNALRFTPPDGVITVTAAAGGDGTLRLAVSDTGAGMSRAELARLTSAANGAGPGTGETPDAGRGCGLPLVHALAAENSGRLEIESSEDRGTTVAVVFAAPRSTA